MPRVTSTLSSPLAAVKEIAAENEGKTVAVFCHGYAIRVLLATLQGYSLEEAGKTPHGDNTAVSLLRAENGRLEVVFRDNTDHLQTAEYLAGEKVGYWTRSCIYFVYSSVPRMAALRANSFVITIFFSTRLSLISTKL